MKFSRGVLFAAVAISLLISLPIYVFIRLQSLRQAQTHFEDLNEALQHPLQVRTLILRNQPIDSLPATIGSLVNIEVLNLSDNGLIALPDCIDNLTMLRELTCENNQLNAVPSNIAQLKHLHFVNLNHNRLTEMPPALASLDSLRTLILSANEIRDLHLHKFAQVENLDLAYNKIDYVSGPYQNLLHLRRLDLYQNDIETLPDSLLHLPLLEELILSGNPLTEESRTRYSGFLPYSERSRATMDKKTQR